MVRFRLTDENSSSSSSSQFLCNFFLALSLSSGVNSLWAPWLCPCPPWLWPWPCPSWLCPCPPWLCAWPFTLAWTCLGGKSTMSSSKISSSTIGGWFACFEYLKDGFSSWEWPWLLATGGSRKYEDVFLINCLTSVLTNYKTLKHDFGFKKMLYKMKCKMGLPKITSRTRLMATFDSSFIVKKFFFFKVLYGSKPRQFAYICFRRLLSNTQQTAHSRNLSVLRSNKCGAIRLEHLWIIPFRACWIFGHSCVQIYLEYSFSYEMCCTTLFQSF